jgi:hypothetical protein
VDAYVTVLLTNDFIRMGADARQSLIGLEGVKPGLALVTEPKNNGSFPRKTGTFYSSLSHFTSMFFYEK